MEKITASLSATFSGQAQTAAATYEGQVKRLSTAADNMKEAFGAGLLRNLGDTDRATQDLVERMGSFESALGNVGEEIGDILLGLMQLTDGLEDVGSAERDTAKATKELKDENKNLAQGFAAGGDPLIGFGNVLIGLVQNLGRTERASQNVEEAQRLLEAGYRANSRAAVDLGNDTLALGGALQSTYRDFINFATVAANSTKTTADQAERAQTATTRITSLSSSLNTYTGSSSGAATATQITTDKLAAQSDVVKTLNGQLQQQTTDLENATTAIGNYAQNVADQITRGFDLSRGLTITDGQANAAEWLSGVDAEVAKYQWFGNVLSEIERQGGPELRDYFANLGVDVGGEMGQAAISGGLVPQLANKLLEVQQAAYNVGQTMVPEFLLAGEESALEFVNGTVKQIEKEEKRLRQIGKNIGKPIGANIKAEIAQAVAEAIRAAEASRTAALAEISAREAATTASAVEQATAQSLARLIRNSDNRAGREVQPVLA
jgi:hypothetical protein